MGQRLYKSSKLNLLKVGEVKTRITEVIFI